MSEEEEKIEVRQVHLDGCPVQWLQDASHHLYEKLEEKCGEPPSLEEAFRVGLLTGGVHIMDSIGIPHEFREFGLVIDREALDS